MVKKLLAVAVAGAMSAPLFAMAGEAAAEPKKTKFAEKEYDMDTKVVTITFGNGSVVDFDLNKVSQEVRDQLALHGASQKIGDSYAGVKGNFAEGVANAKDVVEQLYAGVWRASREDDARPRLAELAAAIARIKGVPLESATAAVEKGTDEQRKTWRSNAKVKAVIAQIRAEKAAEALQAAEASGEQALDITV